MRALTESMRAAVCVVCVVVVSLLGATVAPAGAAGASGMLVQTGATRGVVVAGEAFTGAVGVGGAASQVTFAQTDGAPAVVVSSNGVVTSGDALAAGTYTANGTMT